MKIFAKVLDIARASDFNRKSHFSFIIKRNTIISVGHNNLFKTHPLASKFGHRFNSIHSELDAIKRFPYSLSELRKHTIINVRLNNHGRLVNSKPCDVCNTMLHYFGIEQLYYSTKEGFVLWI